MAATDSAQLLRKEKGWGRKNEICQVTVDFSGKYCIMIGRTDAKAVCLIKRRIAL